MTKMATMPIYVKNPSKIFGTSGRISMKLGRGPSWFVDFSIFCYSGISIGKSENNGFFRNNCSLCPENWYMQTTN